MITSKRQSPSAARQRRVIAVGPHRDARFLEGALRFANEWGYAINPLPWWAGQIEPDPVFGSRGLLGVFGPGHPDALAKAQAMGVALVSMGTVPLVAGIPSACPDFQRVGRLAAEHLIGRGYRRLLVHVDSSKVRGGVMAAAAAAGVEAVDCKVEAVADTVQTHQEAWGPVGVVAVPDSLGLLAVELCLAAGLAVPDEVGIISAGNVRVLCDAGSVPLTSVDPNHEQVGYEAARLMHKLLTGKRVPRKPVVVAPRGVIQRRSTDYVVTARAEVKSAVAYIREHLPQPLLTAQSVADATGLCRSRLDQVFRRQIGRTVAAEIELRRVRAAAQMLVQGRQPIARIARACGFAEIRGLWRAFKRHHSCTPSDYRARNALPPGRVSL